MPPLCGQSDVRSRYGKTGCLGLKKLIGVADFFICEFNFAYFPFFKKEFLHIKIVDQSGARSPKADNVEP